MPLDTKLRQEYSLLTLTIWRPQMQQLHAKLDMCLYSSLEYWSKSSFNFNLSFLPLFPISFYYIFHLSIALLILEPTIQLIMLYTLMWVTTDSNYDYECALCISMCKLMVLGIVLNILQSYSPLSSLNQPCSNGHFIIVRANNVNVKPFFTC